MTATERQTVQALLAWYAAMGADEAIGEAPFDCFATPAPPPRPARNRRRCRARSMPRRPAASACSGRTLCRARSTGRSFRRLRAQAHGEEPLFRAGARGCPAHADRRSAWPRRGSARQALCRSRGPVARPHARGDRSHRGARLHHQHRLLAAARQPHANAGGGRGLRAVPRAADRAALAAGVGAARRRRGQDAFSA